MRSTATTRSPAQQNPLAREAAAPAAAAVDVPLRQ